MEEEKEALYYEKLEDNAVRCLLCPQNCKIKEGDTSQCMGRANINGTLFAINYNKTVSIAIDPIEKKPMFHIYPGSQILSIAGNSCNFHCIFCQNYSISQNHVNTKVITAQKVVDIAKSENSFGIAYTYTEPLIWYEFVLECCKLAQENKLKNIFVTNGSINPDPFNELLPYIDGMNIDLKSIDGEFYKKYCKAKIEPVLKTIETAFKQGVLVEITNLIIPTLNDKKEQIEKLVDFIAGISKDIPLHFSAYHPSYKLDLPRTSDSTLKMAYDIAKARLHYVYVGNTLIPGTSDTYCPSCGKTVIKRNFYQISIEELDGDKCAYCHSKVNVVI